MKLYRKFLSVVLSLSVISSIAFPAVAAEKNFINYEADDVLIEVMGKDYSSVVYPTTIDGFLMRLYNLVMQRDYDTQGINYWKAKLSSGQMNASNVARYFFTCDEFYNLNYSDEEYVTVLYKVFFNRAPDASGKTYWLNQLKAGKSKRYVLEGFISSTEWANTCLNYGVVSGTTTVPTASKAPSTSVTNFVKSLYTDVLGRSADVGGMSYWANELTYMRKSAQDVAKGFFFSSEFERIYKNNSPEDNVKIFYKVFLGRTPDSSGLTYWANQIRSGKSLLEVYNGFCNSTEFASKCAAMGIIPVMPSSNAQYNKPEPVKATPAPTSVPSTGVDKSVKSYSINTTSGDVIITGYYDTQMAYDIFILLNNYRQANGVAPLEWNGTMVVGTNVRATEIVYTWDHYRPNGHLFNTVPNGNMMRGENIAKASYSTAQGFFDEWKNSPGHNSNMLDSSYKTVSISVFVADSGNPYAGPYYYFAVQNFGR
ncbi:MAG: DUF4214 domain-containing protein [Clostridia bacterium]|nr:DUF4214 domain-containing protein [Clostridia bacterium]